MTSHYDCRDCGHYLGISFGQCEACTPPEYFDTLTAVKYVNESASIAWESESAKARGIFIKQYLDDNGYSDLMGKLEDILNAHTNKG